MASADADRRPATVAAPAEASQQVAQHVEFDSVQKLLLPLYLPAMLVHISRSLVLVVLPLEVLQLGFSNLEVGILTALHGLGMVLGNIPAAKLVSARGPRAAQMFTSLGLALGGVLATLATVPSRPALQLLALAISFPLVGLAETTGTVARITFLGASVPVSVRGRVGSTLGGILRLGQTVGPLAGGLAAHLAESRATYLLMVSLSLLSAASVARFVPHVSSTQDLVGGGMGGGAGAVAGSAKETAPEKDGSIGPTAAPPKKRLEENKPSMVCVLRRHWRVILVVSFFSFCLTFLRKAREIFFALEGHDQGLSQASLGKLVALSFALDGSLFPVAGIMMDRVGRRPTGACSSLGLGLATATLALGASVDGLSLAAFICFAVLGGLANGLSAGIVQILAADLAPPSCRGEFIGIFRMLSRAADVGAPLLIGVLARVSTLQVSETVAAAVGLLGAVWMLCFVKETLKQRAAAACKEVDSSEMLPAKEGKQDDLEQDWGEQAEDGGSLKLIEGAHEHFGRQQGSTVPTATGCSQEVPPRTKDEAEFEVTV